MEITSLELSEPRYHEQ